MALQPRYLPTQAEIADACERFQRAWSPEERAERIRRGSNLFRQDEAVSIQVERSLAIPDPEPVRWMVVL